MPEQSTSSSRLHTSLRMRLIGQSDSSSITGGQYPSCAAAPASTAEMRARERVTMLPPACLER